MKTLNLKKVNNNSPVNNLKISPPANSELEKNVLNISARLLHVQENVNKLHELIFNDESIKALLTKIDSIEKKLDSFVMQSINKANNKAETKTDNKAETKTETVEIDSDILFTTFKKLYKNPLPDENKVKDFLNKADFTNAEKLAESFKKYNSESDKLLCARKSNENFKLCAMNAYINVNKADKTIQQKAETVSKPVVDFKHWANQLELTEKHIEIIVNSVNESGLNDENIDLITQYIENENEDVNIKKVDKFIDWLKTLAE